MCRARGSTSDKHWDALSLTNDPTQGASDPIDPRLMKELEAWATDGLRSLNGQIEYILRQAIRKRKGQAFVEGRDTARMDPSQ